MRTRYLVGWGVAMGCTVAAGCDDDLGDDGVVVVGNTRAPGSGDLTDLGNDDDAFVARLNDSWELISVRGVTAPTVGSGQREVTAAALAPDGSLVIVGTSSRRPTEDYPVRSLGGDVWVTRMSVN